MNDHLHLLFSLHPSVALADLIRDIKTSTSAWNKKNRAFPGFRHWQDGYGAFTKSRSDREAVIEYIRNQKEHHIRVSCLDELRDLLGQEGIEFDERFLE